VASLSWQRGLKDAVRPLAFVATICVAGQVLSATFWQRSLETPNASTQIARNLATAGRFGVQAWHRLRGPNGVVPAEPLRAFQLPGEPLYLAAGFRVLPESLWPYLHLPVTLLLVTSIAVVGFFLGGTALGVTAGTLAAIDPFVVAHGPVWDDTFLGAAAEWFVLAAVLSILAEGTPATPAKRLPLMIAISVAALIGAATRLQSQVVLGAIGVAAIGVKRFSAARTAGFCVLTGVIVSVAAWGARNATVLGEFFVGTTHDGLTLYESNYRDARAATWATGTEEGWSETHLTREFADVASLNELEADRYYRRTAWQYIEGHPRDVALTAALKLAVSATGINLTMPIVSPRNSMTIATNMVLLLLAPLGLATWWRRSRRRDIDWFAGFTGALTSAATLGMLVMGPVGLRYRISVAGFLYIGVAVVVLHLVRRWLPVESHAKLAGTLAW
jgi:hypothetical protein